MLYSREAGISQSIAVKQKSEQLPKNKGTRTAFSLFLDILVSWFNPSWQLSTRQPLAHCPPVGRRRESEG